MIKTYPHNIFKILAAIILLGVIAAGYISWQRYNVEAHATTVEMVYDYNNILESASVESTSADELFSLYKRSGITSLAVYDETPKKLADHGYIAVYHGSELISHMSNPLIRGNRIYIASTNTSEGIEYFDELKGQLKRLLRKDDFHIIHLNNEELLEINANYERFLNMPLGIFKTTVKKVEQTGLYIVLRPMNVPHATREDIDQFFSVVDSSGKISAILFQGKEALGYPSQLEYLLGGLKERHLPVVLIEAQNQLGFERQDGTLTLSDKDGYNTVRLYAMSKDELIKLDPKEAASRFYVSTIERNVRMNLFPSYKFAANGETFMDYCVQKKQSAFKNIGWGHLFIEAVLLLWGCGILSLIGAIYISGILSDIRFFLEMNIFRGVKLTFILPLICVSLIYIQRFPFFGKVVVTDKDFIGFVKKFCQIDIKLGVLALISLLGIIGFIFIGRSGNNGAPVPSFEISLRRFLEDIMYARPREKEFLFGHPAILASLAALYHRWPQILHYFLVIAITIGQGSMVETFAHMRSPFILSLIRGIDGLVAGTAVMIIVLAGLIILTHITEFFGSDLLISGGGSLLQDVTSWKSMMYYLSIIGMGIFFRKKVFLYSQGIGPVRYHWGRWILRTVMNHVDAITVRDSESKFFLEQLGVKNRIYYTADAVLSLSPVPHDIGREILRKNHIPTNKKLIGISIRRWMNTEVWTKQLKNYIIKINGKEEYNFVFIPMQFPEDYKTAKEFCDKIPHTFILSHSYGTEELMSLIGNLDLLIGIRLHALIFAALMHVPFIGISYDPKIDSFLQAVNEKAIFGLDDFDEDKLCVKSSRLLALPKAAYNWEAVDILRNKACETIKILEEVAQPRG